MQVRTSGLNLMPLPRPNKSAADHPHGGGRGKSKGNVDPVSPWGMPVSHCDSSLATAQLLNLYRPKEATRLERSESQTNGLSQLENEIKGNEKSSSRPCYLWSFTTLRSFVYKRSSSMYHSRKNVRFGMTAVLCVPSSPTCCTIRFFSASQALSEFSLTGHRQSPSRVPLSALQVTHPAA